MSKKIVRNLDTGVIYNSVKEAAESAGISEKTLSRHCLGHTKTAGGYRWEYVIESNNAVQSTTTAKSSVKSNKSTRNVLKGTKSVLNVDTGETFTSLKQAADKYNLNASNIGKVCRGKYQKCGGYRWKYVDAKESLVQPIINKPHTEKTEFTEKTKINKETSTKGDPVTVEVTINNHSEPLITANYWFKKIVQYDTDYWFGQFLKDKQQTEEEWKKEFEAFYKNLINYGQSPLHIVEQPKVDIKIQITTKTHIDETMEYWVHKIVSFDAKYWVKQFIEHNTFENAQALDSSLKTLYEKVVQFYKTKKPN